MTEQEVEQLIRDLRISAIVNNTCDGKPMSDQAWSNVRDLTPAEEAAVIAYYKHS